MTGGEDLVDQQCCRALFKGLIAGAITRVLGALVCRLSLSSHASASQNVVVYPPGCQIS